MEKKFLDYTGLQRLIWNINKKYAPIQALVFKGNVANIASLPTVADCKIGEIYNVTTGGETTADFVEGAGHPLDYGSNVAAVNIANDGDPVVMKWDILGGILDISNKLSFGFVMPVSPSDGDTFLYLGDTSYAYDEVTPEGSENPSEEGWYEIVHDEYVLSQDTVVDPQKTYYTRHEQYVKGVIYIYSAAQSSWIAQSSGDVFTPIPTSVVNSMFD